MVCRLDANNCSMEDDEEEEEEELVLLVKRTRNDWSEDTIVGHNFLLMHKYNSSCKFAISCRREAYPMHVRERLMDLSTQYFNPRPCCRLCSRLMLL